jgi:hypothetical protein
VTKLASPQIWRWASSKLRHRSQPASSFSRLTALLPLLYQPADPVDVKNQNHSRIRTDGVQLRVDDFNETPDQQFLRSFEARTLPFEQWTHRAHVKVAFLYLRSLPFNEAIERVRAGIKAYNARNNVPEGPTSGYNETTTVAFLHLVAAVMSAYGPVMPTPDADAFCDTHPQLLSRHALRFFYSPQRRMDPRAKLEFLEPDLAPLPRILAR